MISFVTKKKLLEEINNSCFKNNIQNGEYFVKNELESGLFMKILLKGSYKRYLIMLKKRECLHVCCVGGIISKQEVKGKLHVLLFTQAWLCSFNV